MGFVDFLGKQFVDVIDWVEDGSGTLVYRYPMSGREIQNGAKLTVRDSQMALFVNEGKIADLFSPGLHTLTTNTLPILTYLNNWDKAFESPFKSDVYFFSSRLQIGQKWGTATPITIRDKEFGPIRVRAYGLFAYRIADPKLVYEKLSGTTEVYRTTDLEEQLRSVVVTTLSSMFGNADIPFVDMAANQLKFSELLRSQLGASFAQYGLQLDDLQVQSVSLPDELQKHLDERSSIALVGNQQAYAQFQAAKSIPIAAANEGGVAGAGAGMGAGFALGQTMANALGQGMANPSAPNTAAPQQTAASSLELIDKLHDLATRGVISKEEFEAKKAELLKAVR